MLLCCQMQKFLDEWFRLVIINVTTRVRYNLGSYF
jgi:hypothetical protein